MVNTVLGEATQGAQTFQQGQKTTARSIIALAKYLEKCLTGESQDLFCIIPD